MSKSLPPINCSMPGFLALHYFLQFAQTCVHCVSDAIQPSHVVKVPGPASLAIQGADNMHGSGYEVMDITYLDKHPSTHLPVHYPLTHPAIHPPSAHPPTLPSIHPPTLPSIHSSIHPSTRSLPTHSPSYSSIHLLTHPLSHPSIHPPFHLSIHPSTISSFSAYLLN